MVGSDFKGGFRDFAAAAQFAITNFADRKRMAHLLVHLGEDGFDYAIGM